MKINPQLVEWLKSHHTTGLVLASEGFDNFYAAMLTECRMQNLIEIDCILRNAVFYRLTAIGEIAINPATEPAATPSTGAREADSDERVSTVHALIRGRLFNAGILVTDYEETSNGARMRVTLDDLAKVANMPAVVYHRVQDTDDGKRAYIEVTHTHTIPATPPTATVGTGDGEPVYTWEMDGKVYKHGKVIAAYMDWENAQGVASMLNTETASLRTELAAARERIASAQETIGRLDERISSMGKQIQDAAYYLEQANSSDENSNRAYNILQGYSQPD